MADATRDQQRAELHRTIWGIADDLRGSVDAWDFKQYVLTALFYRYISEDLERWVNDWERREGNPSPDYAGMANGIIYVMKTVVPGLVKIGKTGTSNFDARMYQLEHNGYFDVAGLKRVFAIEVADYDEKESMLDEIFSRSRVPNSELFALDVDLVVQLLSSFEGTQVYPKPAAQSKGKTFADATTNVKAGTGQGVIPDGTYSMARKNMQTGKVQKATMRVEGGRFVVPAGTQATLQEGAGHSPGVKQLRDLYVDEDGMSTEDVELSSPSGAGSFVIGASCNGWELWKDVQGKTIGTYRQCDV